MDEYNRAAGASPYSLKDTLQHPLARMLPLYRWQKQVYRLGEKRPPGLENYAPKWECVSVTLAGRSTQQMRVDLENDFHLLAIATSSAAEVGAALFRAQFYDMAKKRRLAGRGVQNPNLGGAGTGVAFLREPYRFDAPGSQLLMEIQNLNAGTNAIQIVLYGVCLRVGEVAPS